MIGKMVTEHFSLAELSYSEAAIRHGIDNIIPTALIPNIIAVAQALEVIRAHYDRPIKITSGYRCPAVNEAVGGSRTSSHCQALAADFTVLGVPNIEVCQKIPELLGVFDQVISEFGPAGWVHLGMGDIRRQLLSAVTEHGKTVYHHGIVAI